MRLLRFVVCNFAQIDHLDIEFPSTSVALILGPNEAGKSHVMQALFGVLFGLPSSVRFDPWHGEANEMRASLQFLLENNVQVTLQRNFRTNTVRVAEDDSEPWEALLGDTGSPADHARYRDLLVAWLGCSDPNVFLSSGFVTQSQLAEVDLRAITARICAGNEYGNGSLIDGAGNGSQEIMDIRSMLALRRLASELEYERALVGEELLLVDSANNDQVRARQSLEQSLLGEAVDISQMVQLEKEVHRAEQSVSDARLSPTAVPPLQSRTTWWVLLVALSIGIAIGVYTLHQPRLFAIVLGVFAVLFVGTGWRLGVLRSSPPDEVPEVRVALEELQKATDRRDRALATLDVASLEQAVELREEYQKRLRAFERIESMAGAEDGVSDLHARAQELDRRTSALQVALDNASSSLRDATVDDLQNQLDQMCGETKVPTDTANMSEASTLDAASSGECSQVLQAISVHASDLLCTITRGKYVAVRVNPHTFSVSVGTQPCADIPAASLSRAAQDQLFFALRVAIARCAAKGVETPLVLDDIFVNLDFVQMNRMIDVLRTLAADTQVVLFSCNSLYEQWFAPVARLPLAPV